ncbi:flagellar hook-length control protein FliK [Glaciihabitans sp. UYNi722]|uniref:flagellar hook-length control protein FliK n=1 Tax=Glaciihabitans sp. UYNi722 TaxID=3156344 RepID=UPI00339B0899
MTLIGLFTGTAPAKPPTGSATGQQAAAGFGAAMLDAQVALFSPAPAAALAPAPGPAPSATAVKGQAAEQPATDGLSQLVAQLPGKPTDAAKPETAPASDGDASDDSAPLVAVAATVTPTALPMPAPAAATTTTPAEGTATPAVAAAVTGAVAATATTTVSASASASASAELVAPPVQAPRSGTKAEAKPTAATAAPGAPATPVAAVPALPTVITAGAPTPAATTTPVPLETLPAVAVKSAKPEVAPVVMTAVAAQDAPSPTPVIVSVTPAAASAALVTVAPTAPMVPQHFAAQLSKPIFSLAAAGPGEHVVTVSVTPDNLGPVTVRAHVGAEGMRVELFAPSDIGRDAIRSILPDLRKDLAGQGLSANLDLSSQNQPTDSSFDGSGRERRVAELQETSVTTAAETEVTPASGRMRDAHSTTLDVLV